MLDVDELIKEAISAYEDGETSEGCQAVGDMSQNTTGKRWTLLLTAQRNGIGWLSFEHTEPSTEEGTISSKAEGDNSVAVDQPTTATQDDDAVKGRSQALCHGVESESH